MHNPEQIYIAGTEIHLAHKALEIYLSGCRHHSCKGCHNPELWEFGKGDEYTRIKGKIQLDITLGKDAYLIEQIWVVGGEPCDQPAAAMTDFIADLQKRDLLLMLWTHLTLPDESDESWNRLPFARYFDYVKMGPYIPGGASYKEPIFGITLANKEQKIIPVPEHLRVRL